MMRIKWFQEHLPPGKKIFKEQKSDERKFSFTFQLICGKGKKKSFFEDLGYNIFSEVAVRINLLP